MLLPVAQFTPAVHAAQDILASVEQAELDEKRLKEEIGKLQGEIDEQKRLLEEFSGRTNQARKEFHAFVDDIARQKQEMEQSLGPLKDQVNALHKEIEGLEKQKQHELEAKQHEIDKENKRLENAQKRYADFKNKL
jgi:chromosome segregation ATPase